MHMQAPTVQNRYNKYKAKTKWILDFFYYMTSKLNCEWTLFTMRKL